MVRRVLFFRPSLSEGGADRMTITVLRHLDRARFAPELALVRAEGPFLADVPSDVPVHDLAASRLALSVPRLAALIRRLEPEVIFSTCSTSNIVAVIAARAARSKARLVLSERNALYRGRSRWHAKQATEVALKRLLYGRADLVTAVSRGVADEVTATCHLAPERVRVVYNPVVDDDLPVRARERVEHPWFSSDIPVVVACARLVAQKDYPTLLDAFARVRAQTRARLFVLGEGPLRGELEQRARALGGDVEFAGFDKNPFKYFARARLLMHASRAEGLPGSLIQAMACGVPVVSTDCDFGPREVIHDGVDGYLVPVGDAPTLAARATAVLADPALRDRLAGRAKESAAQFTLGASMARYEGAIAG